MGVRGGLAWTIADRFPYRFSQQIEMKVHDVDERLDELETLISIFEQKLDSLPPEVFSDMPPVVQSLPNQVPLAPTENPLVPQPPPPPPPQNSKSN
jgi:hypothetical protein